MSLVGLVLAGGRGTRMGARAKPLVALAGRPLLDYARAALLPFVDRIIISSNEPLDDSLFPYDIVPDAVPGQGPLGGLLAGLRAARGAGVLVVPCDVPLVGPPLLAPLVALAGAADVVIYEHAGGAEPLVGVYGPACEAAIARALAAGVRKVTEAHHGLRVVRVPLDDATDFTNVNRPEDLLRVEALLAP